jgi:hypothetical protein
LGRQRIPEKPTKIANVFRAAEWNLVNRALRSVQSSISYGSDKYATNIDICCHRIATSSKSFQEMAGIAKIFTSNGKLDTTFGCGSGYVITDVVHGEPYPTQGPSFSLGLMTVSM